MHFRQLIRVSHAAFDDQQPIFLLKIKVAVQLAGDKELGQGFSSNFEFGLAVAAYIYEFPFENLNSTSR
jgi:hypothetical protein